MAECEGGTDQDTEHATALSREVKVEEADEPTRLGIESINLGRGDEPENIGAGGESKDTERFHNDLKRPDTRRLDHRVQQVQTELAHGTKFKTVEEAKTTNLASAKTVNCTDAEADQRTPDLRRDSLDATTEDSGHVDCAQKEPHKNAIDDLDERQNNVTLLVETLSEIRVTDPKIGLNVDDSSITES